MLHLLVFDINCDSIVDGKDNPFPAGSSNSKLWWKQVEAATRKDITAEMRVEYGNKVKGVFNGKPLVPGERGSFLHPQGDFDFLVQKIIANTGVSESVAIRVAGKINAIKYGH